MKIFKMLTALIILSLSTSYADEPNIYIVKTGDTLSTIAESEIGKPIFTPDGSLYRLLKLNPLFQTSTWIFPGQILFVTRQEAPNTSSERLSNESKTATQSRQMASVESTKSAFEESEITHYFFLGSLLGMTTLTSTDTVSGARATLNTSKDVGVHAGWKQAWTNSFSTKFLVHFRSLDFHPALNSTKSLSDSKKLNMRLGLGSEHKLTSKLAVNGNASYSEEVFVRGLNSSVVTVDSVAVPTLGVGASYRFYEIGKTSVGLNGGVEALLATATDGYTVNSGIAYQLGLFLNRRYGADNRSSNDNEATLILSYRDRSQDTSIVQVREQTIFGTLTFTLTIFGEGNKK